MADRGGIPEYIWDGIYATWEDACRVSRLKGVNGHGDRRWLERIVKQIQDYRNEFSQYGIAVPPRPSSLPFVCSFVNPCSIIDFGGSSGWTLDYLRNSNRMLSVTSYIVVELDQVIEHLKGVGVSDSVVDYRTLRDEFQKCDILYSNSVLQYFDSNAPLLRLIEQSTPNFVLLDDLVAKGDEDLFTLQANYGSAIPYRFLSMSKILGQLEELGYQELMRSPYASPILGLVKPLEMSNFPVEKRIRYSYTVLFKRRCDE